VDRADRQPNHLAGHEGQRPTLVDPLCGETLLHPSGCVPQDQRLTRDATRWGQPVACCTGGLGTRPTHDNDDCNTQQADPVP
jgi:hypothetical protein